MGYVEVMSSRASRMVARTLFASRTKPTLRNGFSSVEVAFIPVAASSRGTAPNLTAGS